MTKEEKETLKKGYYFKIGQLLQMKNINNPIDMKKVLLEIIDILDKIIVLDTK